MYLSHPQSPFAACHGVPSSVAQQVHEAVHPYGQSRRSCKRNGTLPAQFPSSPEPLSSADFHHTGTKKRDCMELKATVTHGLRGGGLYFTCRSAVTARRAGPRYSVFLTRRCQNAAAGGEIARIEGVTWGPFNGATKLKYSPLPCADVKRIKSCK